LTRHESLSVATAPGPPGFFPALQLYNRPFGTMPVYLRELAERYGPVTRLRGPLVDVYLIDDPLALEEVYVTKGRSFMKGRGARRAM